jgi:2-polyprenyl-3-methyl-5-hydroxy-6-metoxy-1,4-benzoquinol methylase
MVAIHEAFYHWVVPQVRGMLVLDAGCGEGYGVNILGKTASTAIGIDIKEELIIHAKKRYLSENLDFFIMDCEKFAIERASFDAVVCNEMLEHLRNYKDFLSDVSQSLKTGGVFFCATTNAELSFEKPDGSPMNRNHFQEFTVKQLTEELKYIFDDIEIFSEIMNHKTSSYILNKPSRIIEWILVKLGIKHKIPIQWRNYIREKITGVNVEDMISDGYQIIDGYYPDSLYIIVKCTK